MLLAFILCLSQTVMAAADEMSAKEPKTETASVSEENAPAEPETEETSGGENDLVSGDLIYIVSDNNAEVIITGRKDETSATGDLVIPDTVKKNGRVRGIDYGTSDISCLYKGFTFNTPVYVEDLVMTFGGREVKNKEKLEMKTGQMQQFRINKTFQTLNFKSSRSASVFIDENGFVYAGKKGRSVISTKINGTTYKLTIEVKE